MRKSKVENRPMLGAVSKPEIRQITPAEKKAEVDSKDRYYQALKHPKWQRKRLEVMNRDNFQCALCKDSETQLHVHHKSYNNKTGMPWDVEDSELITLCEHCHYEVEARIANGAKFHLNRYHIIKYVNEDILASFTTYDHRLLINLFLLPDKKKVLGFTLSGTQIKELSALINKVEPF